LEKSQLQKKGKIATINCTHGVIYDWDLYLSHMINTLNIICKPWLKNI
jgi:hypothetical protein